MPLLASAEPTDLSGSQMLVVLIILLVIAVVGAMTATPIAIARRRFHRQAEAVTVAALVWGLLAAGSALYFWLAKLNWSKEYRDLIMTGYYDPQNTGDAPTWPWRLWVPLAAAFVALIVYSLSQKNPPE